MNLLTAKYLIGLIELELSPEVVPHAPESSLAK